MRAEHQRQRSRSRGHADTVLSAAVLGELGFEALELGAQGERTRAEQPREGCLQLALNADVLSIQRHEAYGVGATLRSYNGRHGVLSLVGLREMRLLIS